MPHFIEFNELKIINCFNFIVYIIYSLFLFIEISMAISIVLHKKKIG